MKRRPAYQPPNQTINSHSFLNPELSFHNPTRIINSKYKGHDFKTDLMTGTDATDRWEHTKQIFDIIDNS